MIKQKLKERTYLVKATPLPERIKDAYNHRRSFNAVELEEDDENKFDTFFDYEDDLANLKPSGEQYAELHDDRKIGVLEERVEASNESEIEFKQVYEESAFSAIVMEDKNESKSENNQAVGFKFIQCSFVKSNGDRCKRQAPKNYDICSTHRRYIEKHNLE